jgi:hypothetical protein
MGRGLASGLEMASGLGIAFWLLLGGRPAASPRVESSPAPTYYESGAYHEPRIYELRTYERLTYDSTGAAPYVEEDLPPPK